MPKLRLPDSAELYWEERGEGPLVVTCHPCTSVRAAFPALVEDLARDHRVVSYDPRGTGESSRDGPLDLHTDIADLTALVEALGPPAVLLAFGDALHRAVELGAARPDLVTAVVSPGPAALGAQSSGGGSSEGLASSPAVVEALAQLLERDYRAGLRTVVEGGNPQFSEGQVQERIDAIMASARPEVTLARLRIWADHDSREPARALGDRLWFLIFGGNVWFPPELADGLRRAVPDAHIEHVEDGAVSRPDLTAGIVRRITVASLPPHAEGVLRVQKGPGVRPQSEPLDGGD